jgi:hypothetical protein
MPFQVVNLAATKCIFGASPSTLSVTPANKVMCGNQPAANIMDFKPNVNIMPFGMCQTPTNPAVAAATAAAMGVLTPQPCVPVTTAPWIPGALTTLIANMPALTDNSVCICAYGGIISITSAGQTTVQVGAGAPDMAAVGAAAATAAQQQIDSMAAEADAAAAEAAEAAAKYGPNSPQAQAAAAKADEAAATAEAAQA